MFNQESAEMYSLFVKKTNLKQKTMRKRINKRAVCSSDNYHESKVLHIEHLIDNHCTFGNILKSEVTVKAEELAALHSFKPQYVTVKVMGREQRVSVETYEKYYKHLGF